MCDQETKDRLARLRKRYASDKPGKELLDALEVPEEFGDLMWDLYLMGLDEGNQGNP